MPLGCLTPCFLTSPQFKTHCLSRLRLSLLDVSPTCLRDDAGVRPACLRVVSSTAHVSSRRRVSSPDLSSGSVFARPRVFATMRVFDRPGFGTCHRPPTCLRDDACPRPTCLRDVSSHAHVSSRRRVPSRDLSSATVLKREHGFTTGSALAWAVRSGSVFGHPPVFAPRNVFDGDVSSDAHVSSLSSPGKCLPTPRCLRRPCFETSVLDPTCLQIRLRPSANMCTPPGERNALWIFRGVS